MAIVRDAKIHKDDVLEVRYHNGVITLTAKHTAPAKRSLMDFVGITKGTYGQTPKQVAAYLDKERNSWDR
jgi:hypothetical protein